jgi:hypothetical protein
VRLSLHRRRAITVVLAAALGPTGPGAAARADVPMLTVDGDRVTVHARHARLADVLGVLAREAALEVRGRVSSTPISAEFSALPLEDALRRLLGDRSFSLVYGPDGAVRAVRLLGGGEDTVLASPPPLGVPADLPPAAEPLPPSKRPVAVSGRLARALGAREASFEQLVELALRSDDEAVRRDALRIGLGLLETEPGLHEGFVDTVRGMSEETIVRWLRQHAGVRARPFVAAVLRAERSEGLRAKAEAVLRRLDEPGDARPTGVGRP